MGQAAVRRLLTKSSEKGPCYKMQICTEFVERDSVRQLNNQDPVN